MTLPRAQGTFVRGPDGSLGAGASDIGCPKNLVPRSPRLLLAARARSWREGRPSGSASEGPGQTPSQLTEFSQWDPLSLVHDLH